MCFSVNVNIIKEELERRYDATLIDPDKYRPSYYYHAFSLPELPAVCSDMADQLHLLKWGLIPYWVANSQEAEAIKYKTFNARSETIDKKPSFSSSFTSKRCIIPVKGFFEWQHLGKEKRPWYIYGYSDEILSLAGLFDEWTESSTGVVYSTFSIVTTVANELMSEIHNSAKRMPLILNRSEEKVWLDLSTSKTELQNILKPYPDDLLNAHTIGPLINNRNADRNNQNVIKQFNYMPDNLLF